MEYSPGSTLLMTNWPASFVCTVRCAPLATLTRFRRAEATVAPLLSVTEPEIEPVTACDQALCKTSKNDAMRASFLCMESLL